MEKVVKKKIKLIQHKRKNGSTIYYIHINIPKFHPVLAERYEVEIHPDKIIAVPIRDEDQK